MSADDIRRKAGKLERKVFWLNALNYVAALVVVIFFGSQFWHTPDALTRVGFGLLIAGMLNVAWQLHRKGSSRSLPADMGLASGLEFFKRELERRRDLPRTIWPWGLAPLIPGWVVLTVAVARTNPGHLRHLGLSLTVFNLVAAAAVVFVWKLDQRAARRLQRQIDELDALQKQQ